MLGLINKQIQGYVIEKQLGEGRYGVCYLARNSQNQKVVLKRFRPSMFKRNRDHNHHEAVLLSQLNHPAIPQLLGVINDKAAGYFFVLELKAGFTLEHLLFQKKIEFTETEIFRIGSQLLGIIKYLADNGVVHRDISIANVMDDGSHISLIDFGLARYMGVESLGFDLDFAGFGNLLLYLLYSGFKDNNNKGAWYEQLQLSEQQREFLKRLLGLDLRYDNLADILIDFGMCFKPETSH